MTAIKEDRQWEPPEFAAATIIVWRQEGWAHYRALPAGERAGLKAAAAGADFASICAAVASEMQSSADVVEMAETINRMLTGWLRDRILIHAR